MTQPSKAALFFLFAISACDWRKPLPRGRDAGPPVELVEARPPVLKGAAPAPTIYFTEEHEPNDDRDHAQPIAIRQGAVTGVRGSLAPPTALGAGLGAVDWYSVTLGAGTGPQQLRLELSGSPQADLSLDLLDGGEILGQRSDKPFAHVDDHGRGEAERISLGLRPGQRLLLRVRGTITPGTQPKAAPEYQLTLFQAAAPPGSEIEPNDTPETASAASAPDLSGTLPWQGDEDFWVINLADALANGMGRGARAEPGQKNPPPISPPGLIADAILRIELRTPGAIPAVRLLLEPAAIEEAAANKHDLFNRLKFVLDLTAPKGAQELRLRNVGIPSGSARAYLGVRTSAPLSGKGQADVRYQLRLTVEPALEDAETEPNDDCERATSITLSENGAVREGRIAGFLWPGDIDCFRVRSTVPLRHSVKLALPSAGKDCQAALEWVRSDGADLVPEPPLEKGALPLSLTVRARGDFMFRVVDRDHKTCFDAPYRLSLRADGERP